MNLDTVKSKLADAGHTVDESFINGRHVLMDTTRSVGSDLSQAAARANSSFRHSDAVRTLGNVAAAVTSARALASVITPEKTFRWMLRATRLQRRPSVYGRIAKGTGFIVVGAVVGAGVAMLLAPKTGAQNRARIADGVRAFRRDLATKVRSVESKAHDVLHDVEDRARTRMGGEAPPQTQGNGIYGQG